MFRRRPDSRIALPAIVLGFTCLLAGPSRAAGPPEDSRWNSLGVGLVYLSPGSPLDGSTGAAIRYARSFAWGTKKKATNEKEAAGPERIPRPFVLDASLAAFDLDRADDGTAPAATVSVTQVSMGLLRTIASRGRWSFAAGGGLDYFLMDADSSFRADPGLGIKSRYEVDNGLGFHGQFDVTGSIGPRAQFVVTLRYLAASLDGTHQFTISGVPGDLDRVDFDLGGPLVGAGFAWRF